MGPKGLKAWAVSGAYIWKNGDTERPELAMRLIQYLAIVRTDNYQDRAHRFGGPLRLGSTGQQWLPPAQFLRS